MTYTVVWKPAAERDLAQIWVSSQNPAAIARAANRIDADLRLAPQKAGESRDDGHRILCVLPLVVGFRVSEADSVVTVLRVRAFDPE
jgi:plasmid stabilization system protein ParE